MKKLLLLIPTIMLTGCLATAPKFPDIPPELKTTCPELNEVANGTTELSKVLDVVVVNYSTYYECRVKIDAWLQWHKEQKEIFDKAVK
jgi:hypothetical protein